MEPAAASPNALPGDVPGIIEAIRDELTGRFASAADDLAATTLRDDPAYASLITRTELSQRIHRNLCQALTAVTQHSQGLPIDLDDALSTGHRRVQQGLPLASLLHAYRRGGRLLWEVVTEVVAEREPEALPTLLPVVSVIWDVVEQITDAVAESYRQADAARAARDQVRRHALLDALLEGSGAAAGLASEAAALLGLPERARYAVVVLRADPAGRPPSSDPGFPGEASGVRILWRIRADGETGLVHLGDRPVETLRELLAPHAVRAGVSPAVGALSEAGRARWLAELALRTCGRTSPKTALLDERLPMALVAAQTELAGRLRTVVFGPVLSLPPDDCATLLSTLEVWLTSSGSMSAAAQRLYCHRNTVANRLRRLEQLTGRSLTDPAHIVETSLALTAVQQLTPTAGVRSRAR
ncbi:PucR family transcriptional regulator [Streptomyces marispadix]|uniref:Helix-turn-helix domain-containing protein n=1 Tax=Streptomyces marispadix TaxID=2922868 RepID=A0ABS9T256_9ACTN|nr:helix-turn-helix domain-containing protein [Streptomyces marispadix]MCH6162597.1 helix-turn-helix domain-containing protein [Streptomyces marispadix]